MPKRGLRPTTILNHELHSEPLYFNSFFVETSSELISTSSELIPTIAELIPTIAELRKNAFELKYFKYLRYPFSITLLNMMNRYGRQKTIMQSISGGFPFK